MISLKPFKTDLADNDEAFFQWIEQEMMEYGDNLFTTMPSRTEDLETDVNDNMKILLNREHH